MPVICSGTGKQSLGALNSKSMGKAIPTDIYDYFSVDASQTSKLGWSKDTFADTYAPQLPKAVNFSVSI